MVYKANAEPRLIKVSKKYGLSCVVPSRAEFQTDIIPLRKRKGNFLHNVSGLSSKDQEDCYDHDVGNEQHSD
jgi:hypothetical protein